MQERGLSNVGLGKLADVDDSTISRIKNGKDAPGIDTLRKIAPHIGKRFGDLLCDVGLATPEELGMVNTPPPRPYLPPPLQRVIERLAEARYTRREKLALLNNVDRAIDMWDEFMSAPKEPKMRNR